MQIAEAVELISGAVPERSGTWADLGAGDGTFTQALLEILGPGSRIYAVDRDARALATLARQAKAARGEVVTVDADFTRPFELPGVDPEGLDGILLANALHFVPDPRAVLRQLTARLAPGGRVVLVEYDHRRANRWVPYPIDSASLPAIAAAAGLATPVVTATRPSSFGGDLYVAYADLSS